MGIEALSKRKIERQENTTYPQSYNLENLNLARDILLDEDRRQSTVVNTIRSRRAILRHGMGIDDVSIEYITLDWEEKFLDQEVSEINDEFAFTFYHFLDYSKTLEDLGMDDGFDAEEEYEYRYKTPEEKTEVRMELKKQAEKEKKEMELKIQESLLTNADQIVTPSPNEKPSLLSSD